jgi:hypothetical protein
MISAFDFTERDQVARVKLQLRVQVERFDVMDLQALAFVATGHTSRLPQEMLLLHTMPLRAAFLPMFPGYCQTMVSPPWPPAPLSARTTCSTSSSPAPSAGESQDHEQDNEYRNYQHERRIRSKSGDKFMVEKCEFALHIYMPL